MNNSDRVVILKIYDCLRKIESLVPSNPADIQRNSQCCRTVSEVVPLLMNALSSARFGDDADAIDAADHAMTILGLKEPTPCQD